MEINKKGIFYPAFGLISILTACLIGITSTGLNVHSGEIFIWILLLMTLGIILPTVSFVKSLAIVRLQLGQDKSKTKTWSIALTYSLGTVLVGLLLLLLWTMLR